MTKNIRLILLLAFFSLVYAQEKSIIHIQNSDQEQVPFVVEVVTEPKDQMKGLMYRSRGPSPVSGTGPSDDASAYMKVAVITASSLLSQKHCFKNQPRPPESAHYFLSADVAAVAPESSLEVRLSYAENGMLNHMRV